MTLHPTSFSGAPSVTPPAAAPRSLVERRLDTGLCLRHPDRLFVFGDNLVGVGNAGQALIRTCENAFGIPTKRFPAMTPDSFFSDQDDEFEAVDTRLNRLLEHALSGRTVVFPRDGLGTGLAQLPARSPRLFRHLCVRLNRDYGLVMSSSGFSHAGAIRERRSEGP